MLTDLVLGGGLGVLAALLLSIPALIAEVRRRHGAHPLLLDLHRFGGRELSDRETFALGMLLHLLLGLGFGVLYPLNPQVWSIAAPYSFASLSLYAAALYGFAGIVVLPLMGAGLFGWREDHWSWFELLVSMVLLVVMWGAAVHWFQPSWFVL